MKDKYLLVTKDNVPYRTKNGSMYETQTLRNAHTHSLKLLEDKGLVLYPMLYRDYINLEENYERNIKRD